MKKITLINYVVMFFFTLTIIACKKNGEDSPESCDYELDISHKWYNTYTTIESYSDDARTKKTSTTIISPVGFLKVDPNGSYEIVSDDIAQIGNWKIDKISCQLVLSDKSVISIAVHYDVLNLSSGNLVVKKVVGNTVHTEHYKTAACPSVAQLTKRWDNDKIFYFNYFPNTNTIFNPYLVYPIGYFKLNTDLTYNVVSNGVPLNGTWRLGLPYCMIDLDAEKYNARSFEVVKITTDSLVIWRKDAANSKAYLQYYLKH